MMILLQQEGEIGIMRESVWSWVAQGISKQFRLPVTASRGLS
jgi:hypothetical protein